MFSIKYCLPKKKKKSYIKVLVSWATYAHSTINTSFPHSFELQLIILINSIDSGTNSTAIITTLFENCIWSIKAAKIGQYN